MNAAALIERHAQAVLDYENGREGSRKSLTNAKRALEAALSPPVFVPRREGENCYVVAARLRLMREALRLSGIERAGGLIDQAEACAIDLLAAPDNEQNYTTAEALISSIEMLFEPPTRELTTCVNGHRSTVPVEAISSVSAATYCCPECGKGVPYHGGTSLSAELQS
jgi:hypothetical protein